MLMIYEILNLVTGGNSSIGFAVGQLLVADGVHIFITDRWQSEFDAAV
jgi:NAD(P)-dependent dehydrogenase (short-subunit alcohol dehydrogenase family)